MPDGNENNLFTITCRQKQFVNDVFQVHDITQGHRPGGLARFAITLADSGNLLSAIAGPQAEALAINDMVQIRGCFMLRKGKRVLVICSLKRLAQLDPR